MDERIFDVTQHLPNDDQRCMCYGHRTFCCSADMDERADWHEVTFRFHIGSYRLKKQVPKNPAESILSEYLVVELWECGEDKEDRSDGHVIGVTKWKKLQKN